MMTHQAHAEHNGIDYGDYYDRDDADSYYHEINPDPCADTMCPAVVCLDGSNPPKRARECCGDLSLCPANTPFNGQIGYIVHIGRNLGGSLERTAEVPPNAVCPMRVT